MNRDKKNNFLMIITSYSFNEKSEFVMDWYWTHNTTDKCSDGHHFRLADVDWIHFEFDLGFQEIGHGDRFYPTYYYNSSSSEVIWKHFLDKIVDVWKRKCRKF